MVTSSQAACTYIAPHACMPNSINGGLFSEALMESRFPAAQVRGRGRVRVRVGVKVRVRVGGYG